MKGKKRAITMIEVMIVICLIGIISGVLAYNFRGSLDRGKEFKTREGADRVRNILMLAVVDGAPIDDVVERWDHYITTSPLAGRADQLIKDGWGQPYVVGKTPDGDITVASAHQIKKNNGI